MHRGEPGRTGSLYDMSPNITSLEEGVEAAVVTALEPRIVVKQPRLAVIQGYNDFGKIGYGGPCPPRGVHHYVFRLYALDERTGLPPGATRTTVFKAIEGHILAEGHLMGKYAAVIGNDEAESECLVS